MSLHYNGPSTFLERVVCRPHKTPYKISSGTPNYQFYTPTFNAPNPLVYRRLDNGLCDWDVLSTQAPWSQSNRHFNPCFRSEMVLVYNLRSRQGVDYRKKLHRQFRVKHTHIHIVIYIFPFPFDLEWEAHSDRPYSFQVLTTGTG